ncbi:MAG: hypothetical protein AUJ47_09715 [Candidatus Marinimicrobia bacterium CG1_02_48_14]|nr:MAG: hypothetical protein AUJ47_09715 [Candidatus Marinimicrobia bacterium CG1_02_48_14]
MSVEEKIFQRLAELIEQSKALSVVNEYGQCVEEKQLADCSAWITAAQNAVHLIFTSPNAPYRLKADRIAGASHGYVIPTAVAELASVLRSMVTDANAGLLASVANQARAETFDDFLDHADAYVKEGRKNEAGVIAGVVFEDTLRQVCRNESIAEKGLKLDGLISELTTRGELSGVKAKRVRVAAHVRTKASHAQWDEYELEDVRATIEFTRELISAKLDK